MLVCSWSPQYLMTTLSNKPLITLFGSITMLWGTNNILQEYPIPTFRYCQYYLEKIKYCIVNPPITLLWICIMLCCRHHDGTHLKSNKIKGSLWAYEVGQDRSDSKSSRLYVDIFHDIIQIQTNVMRDWQYSMEYSNIQVNVRNIPQITLSPAEHSYGYE